MADSRERGTCDLKQYEHSGLHKRICEHGQKLPPFPCVNWKPAPEQGSAQAQPRCPKCGSAKVWFKVTATMFVYVLCADCPKESRETNINELADFAQFFPAAQPFDLEGAAREAEAIRGLVGNGVTRYSRDRGMPNPTPAFPYEIVFSLDTYSVLQKRVENLAAILAKYTKSGTEGEK